MDEIILNESPKKMELLGPGEILSVPDFIGDLKYMSQRMEIRDITIGSLEWIPVWVLELHLENCNVLKLGHQLPGNIIHLTCRNSSIVDYSELITDRLSKLDLNYQGLTRLPDCLAFQGTNILFLNLNNNQIKFWSVWPVKVRGLRLAGNQLTSLGLIGHLPPYLEDLDVSNNKLTEFPLSLPVHLRRINMCNNELQYLPEDIKDYPPNLRELNLSGNCSLNDLTDSVFPDMLTTLNLANCEIDKLPHEWDCYCLTHLDISFNNIENIDDLPSSVMNIYYEGNPCYPSASQMDSSMISSSLVSSVATLSSVASESNPSLIESSSPEESIQVGSSSNLINQSENLIILQNSDKIPTPSPIHPKTIGHRYIDDWSDSLPPSPASSIDLPADPDVYNINFKNMNELPIDIDDYKDAIKRSSSENELIEQEKMQKQTFREPRTLDINDDPVIKALDYMVTTGVRRVESFFNVINDMLTIPPEVRNISDMNISGQVLDNIDNYGILGQYE